MSDYRRIDPQKLDRFITRDDDRAECPDCEGTGYGPEKNPNGEQPPYERSSEPCPRCDGSGSIGKL